jgi:hypothetical protein
MGREVRMIKKGWEHPKKPDGRYVPLWEGSSLQDALREFAEDPQDFDNIPPNPADYMPVWQDGEATMFVMYEDTSEGTPISPAFETPEELARWLTDNGASAFGSFTADYDQWLGIAKGGYSPGLMISMGSMKPSM